MEYEATGVVTVTSNARQTAVIDLINDLSARKAPRILGIETLITGYFGQGADPHNMELFHCLRAGDRDGETLSNRYLGADDSVIPGTAGNLSSQIRGGTPVGGFLQVSSPNIYLPPFELVIPYGSVTLYGQGFPGGGTPFSGEMQVSVRIIYDNKTVPGSDLYALTLRYS